MELTVLFMISCVLIARKFERRKMKMASVAYSVTFVVILIVLLFSVDIEIVRRALVNILGEAQYLDIHEALIEAIGMAYYGVSVASAMTLSLVVQLAIIVIDAFKAVVCYCFAKKSIAYKFKKAYLRFAQFGRSLCLPKRINLLYCRMLN